MKTKELRAILENLSRQEDDHRIMIAVDGREWDIESVTQEYNAGNEDCLVIDARTGAGRRDLLRRSSTEHYSQMKDSPAPAIDQGSRSSMGETDQTLCKTLRTESQTTILSQGVLSRIQRWLGIGRLSYVGGVGKNLNSQTNVLGHPAARRKPEFKLEACRCRMRRLVGLFLFVARNGSQSERKHQNQHVNHAESFEVVSE